MQGTIRHSILLRICRDVALFSRGGPFHMHCHMARDIVTALLLGMQPKVLRDDLSGGKRYNRQLTFKTKGDWQ